MKHLTLGVAGHIDHGKTALVRALTGTDTDRLKEERERGMSIVLGFAHLILPGGEIDLIDAPGHEKFVKTMIAGATGLDGALLLVAANERIKPQTVEHAALLGLLGVPGGVVVMSKCDLVPDAEGRARVAAELREFLAGTFLRDAPLLFVSAVTGEGMDGLQDALAARLASAAEPQPGPFWTLPVDRTFTFTGQGTVVTGTLRRGILKTGQAVEIWPSGRMAAIRGLQVHGHAVAEARPGQRVAVNLRGVAKEDIPHGSLLAAPRALRPTRLLDAPLTVLASASRSVKRGQVLTLHCGTAEIAVRAFPLGVSELAPGESGLVQFRLAADFAVPEGEPFVVRLPSPPETLGGGRIVDPYPVKHTQSNSPTLAGVRVMALGTTAEKAAHKLLEAGPAGRDWRQLLSDLGLCEPPADVPTILCAGGLALHADVFAELAGQIEAAVKAYHAAHPLRLGMPADDLRRRLPRTLPPAALTRLLETLAERGTLETRDGLTRTTGYNPEAHLSDVEYGIARDMEAAFRDGGLTPPDLDTVLKRDRRRKRLYAYLTEIGALVPVTERLSGHVVVFHRDALTDAAVRLGAMLADGAGLTVSEINARLGLTRKFSVPLLEHLTATGVLRRVGDLRFLP